MTCMTYDGGDLARAWLSVAVASSKDEGRPALNRTVSIEAFPSGLRLVATDSYVLLEAWVPNVETFDDPPELDEAPYARAVAFDQHGRAKNLFGHVLGLAAQAAKDEIEAPEMTVHLCHTERSIPGDDDAATFAGMDVRYITLELPGRERLKLQTYEGDYPDWRHVLDGFEPLSTSAIALNPEIVGRLAKLGSYHGNKPLGWIFGGAEKMARIAVIDSEPRVAGVVMPVRWDFEKNAPRDDTEPAGEGETA